MSRTYEATHPWLTFELDMRRFDPQLWMRLGEAASKCEHIAGVPLDPEVAKRMHHLYLVKGAVATTAIEGNTLSEDEADKILSKQMTLPRSQQYMATELLNIETAFNYILERIKAHGPDHICTEFLCELNRMVMKDLELEEGVTAGEIRRHAVVVGRYRCAPVEDCKFLLDRLCDVLNSFPCPPDEKNEYSIVRAVFAHLYLVWIHPFGDGNGRTARLLELYILLAAGLPTPAGHLLSNYYNKTRPLYYKWLNDAIRGQDGVIDFIKYSVRGLVEGLAEQIDYIRDQQWNVSWINYVHQTLGNLTSASDSRKKNLVLELSKHKNGIPLSKLRSEAPEIAIMYMDKTPKTLARDINSLVEMKLVTRSDNMIRANREMILAFLPWRNC
jgi:Fic family protein